MAQLLVSVPNQKPRQVTIQVPILTIGRGENNALVLHDEYVSTNHAELRFESARYIIRDLGSANGTLVNGKPVTQKELVEEDRITVGRCSLIFIPAERETGKVVATPGTVPDLQAKLARVRDHMRSVRDSLVLVAKSEDERAPGSTKTARPNILAIGKAYRRLEALYEASRLVVSELDLKKRLESILDSAIRVTGADRGFIVLVDADDGGLHLEIAREMGTDATESSPSMGIASRSAIHGELVLAEDAMQDARFSSRESVVLGRIHSAMSVPLRVKERILGSIYVDSRDLKHRFTNEDLELFEAVASESAIAIENARLTDKMIQEERRRANLERFLSPRVVEEVINTERAIELGGKKREITTLFSDIRGFTGLAEKMMPTDVMSMLNEYFTEMTEVIFRHDGTLDKYVGDEIMAVFGAPMEVVDHTSRAVAVALEMQQELEQLREKWLRAARPIFQIGIGIATGMAIAGYLGSPKRMEFTAIGDIVNVARRLCAQAEPGQILVCGDTFERVKETVSANFLGPILLEGKERQVSVYEVLGVR